MIKPRFEVYISVLAALDVTEILIWSAAEFGDAAARRYEALIVQALIDIGEDPQRPGAKERPDLLIDGARTYHLALSRSRVSGPKVKTPRHFVLYRHVAPDVIDVGRILHDSRDLVQHLPEDYQRTEL